MNLTNKIFTGLIFTGVLFTIPGVHFIVSSAVVAQTQTTEELNAEAERLFQQGQQLLQQGTAESLQQAIAKFKQALSLYQQLGDQPKVAFASLGLGFIYQQLGFYSEALEYFNQALPLYRELGDIGSEATTLNNIGFIYDSLGKKQEALESYNQALSRYEIVSDITGKAGTLINIGLLYDSLREFSQALAYYNQALPIFRAVNNIGGEAIALNSMGMVYASLGEFPQALAYYNQALPLFEKIGDISSQGLTLHNIGTVHFSLGEFQQAANYYQQALSLRKQAGHRQGQSAILNSIGNLYFSLGKFRQALEYYHQALSIAKEISHPQGEASTLFNIAEAYISLGEVSQALEYYNQAFQLFQKISDRRGEASTFIGIGLFFNSIREFEQALAYYNQALPIFRSVQDKKGEAATLNNIGLVYTDLGEFQQALEYYNQALNLRRALDHKEGEINTLANIAVTKKLLGNLTEALTQINAAINLIENLRSNIINPDLRQSYFSTVQSYYELKIDLLMQLHQKNPNQGYDALALQTSENSRARVLTELLTEANLNIREGVDPNLLAEEKRLNQQLSAKEKQRQDLVSASYNPSDLDNIKAEIDGILKQLYDLETKIRQNSPTYANLKYPQALYLAEIQALLDEDTLLLEYALGTERSYLFLVGKNIFQVHQIPAAAEIDSAIEAYLEVLKSPSETDLNVGQNLSDMLLSTIADKLDKQRLIIVGNGKLQLLPFAALPISSPSSPASPSSPSSPSPLLVNHEIISLPSFTSIAVQRKDWEKRPPAPKTLAVLADPIFDANDPRIKGQVASNNQDLADIIPGIRSGCSSLSRLPYTAEEANNILAQFTDGKTLSALGFEATRSQAISPNLQDYNMVHLATHGCIEDNLLLSGLAFSRYDESGNSQDSFLRLQDIFNLRLNADLVVLSACETGTGDNVTGEGIVGLTRGFMYAGARRVVVSLWAVNDASTASLMNNFYQKMWQENLSPSAALRAAQLDMWESGNWRSPYYWAAFTIQGDW